MTTKSSVAVIGAGISGCVTALTLAEAGCRVCLFERGQRPMRGASYVNEGKIHLGFVYVNDPTLRSLDTMIGSAMVFRSVLERWISPEDFDAVVTNSFEYIVPLDSQMSPDSIEDKFRVIERKIGEAEASHCCSYLGCEHEMVWARSPESPSAYRPDRILAHYQTMERSVDTHAVVAQLAAQVSSHDKIELHLGTAITEVKRERSIWFLRADEKTFKPFNAVVNAGWNGRLELDEQVFGPDETPWLHRYKAAVNLYPENGHDIPNCTIILGPYGDVVAYPSGRVYLSWYPTGMLSSSHRIEKVLSVDPSSATTQRNFLKCCARSESRVRSMKASAS